MGVNFGREFLGGLKPGEKQGRIFAENIYHQDSLGISPAIFLEFARPK